MAMRQLVHSEAPKAYTVELYGAWVRTGDARAPESQSEVIMMSFADHADYTTGRVSGQV